MEIVSTVFGFADAISFIIRYVYEFINLVLPSNVGLMFGIAFTVVIALAIKRGVLA